MGRMKELAMMMEYDREHLMMCETKDLVDIIEFYKQCDRVNETESIQDEIERLKSERDDLFARIGMLEEMAANKAK
jgi:hypothetical protein